MKKTSTLFSMLFIFAMFLLVGSADLLAQGTQPPGSGTSGDPYQVSTLDHLEWISLNSSSWGSFFVQTDDIDASATSGWNGGQGFSPIGNNTTQFSGAYDGQGYTIDGLHINRPSSGNVGLFGYAGGGAEFSNLGLTNIDITGGTNTGGLAGLINTNCSVANCFVSGGSVDGGENDYIGGLVGYNRNVSSISDSYADCSVTGRDIVGGLAGASEGFFVAGTAVSTSYALGSVSGRQMIGGLVGYNNFSDISDSYARGSVDGSLQRVGGLVGYHLGAGSITNSYSAGAVSGTTTNIGGLVGHNFNGTTPVNDSFWDTETSGQSTSGGGTGKTTAAMKDEMTFTSAGWDFTTVWQIIGGDYPTLRGGNAPAVSMTATTTPDPFVIQQGGVISISLRITNNTPSPIGPVGFWVAYTSPNGTVYEPFNGPGIFAPRYPITFPGGVDQTFNFGPASTNPSAALGVHTFTWKIGTSLSNIIASETITLTITPGPTLGKTTSGDFNDGIFASAGSNDFGDLLFANAESGEPADLDNWQDADKTAAIPDGFALEQNYPNPFNPSTNIRFAIPEAGTVTLQIFSSTGQLVRTLVAGEMPSGYHTVSWNATDDNGARVASGLYLYTLKADPSTGSGQAITMQRKLVLMK